MLTSGSGGRRTWSDQLGSSLVTLGTNGVVFGLVHPVLHGAVACIPLEKDEYVDLLLLQRLTCILLQSLTCYIIMQDGADMLGLVGNLHVDEVASSNASAAVGWSRCR